MFRDYPLDVRVLVLAINDIDHTKTKVKSPQNDLDEWIDHYNLDEWIDPYNNERTHQGKICEGRTPMQTLEEGKAIWRGEGVGAKVGGSIGADILAPDEAGAA